MLSDMTVHQNHQPIYDIVFRDDFKSLRDAFQKTALSPTRICIITDSNVCAIHLKDCMEALSGCAEKIVSFTFPAGESQKTLDTVQNLYEFLITEKFDRKDVLIALGGGVVGDLTGFTAATYLRGVSFVQIPTTLLSMVDSSVGGKTGVDFKSYKNMVGAFYMPKLVYMNLTTLKTLPQREIACGMAEVIKYGYIMDAAFLDYLSENASEIKLLNLERIRRIVHTGCECKRVVVEEDPTEQGRRALLNFGHTIGHAIEKLMNFSLLHGECVAIGMVAAMYLCNKRGSTCINDMERLKALLAQYDLPTCVSDQKISQYVSQIPSASNVLDALKSDKKMEAGKIKFILLDSIGVGTIDKKLSDEELLDAIEYIL